MEQEQYTFEDWVNGRIKNNDSTHYFNLMPIETLNRIQEEQAKTYEFMITCSLENNQKFYNRKEKESLDTQKAVELIIENIQTCLNENKQVYLDVIFPKKHRGIKIGATLITPKQYLKYKNGFLDAFIPDVDPKSYNIYAQVEVRVLWLELLKAEITELVKSLTKKYTPSHLIRTDLILKLYTAFNNVLFKDITESEFMECFDLANTPGRFPTYKNQNGFIAILNELTPDQGAQQKMSAKVALDNFGINKYDQLLYNLSDRAHFATRNKTRTILKPIAIIK